MRDLDVSDIGEAACVVTSPPYNVGVGYDTCDDALPDSSYRELAEVATRLMADTLGTTDGRAWVNVGVARLHLWLDALASADLAEHNVVCWDYGIATSETAWGSWQSPSAPHLRHGWEPVICATAGRWARSAPEGMRAFRDGLGAWPVLCRDIWRIPPGASTRSEHPAVMPAALATRCIRLSTWPAEVVLDPFAGSGTTLVAAKALGRRAVGVEASGATASWRPLGSPRECWR
ncbi:MAG: site-specific DNA-methyltransferase [Actinomycetota bacterium]|nr:site-specific DNA-methyltransferase [Actinomycetota bacterium]